MMNRVAAVLILFVSLQCISCSKNDSSDIDPVFEPYVARFFEEASARGFDIRREDYNFSIEFDDIGRLAGGTCQYVGNKITISDYYWNQSSESYRELVMFHELGHCILDRRHDDEVLRFGHCKSLMRGDVGTECYSRYESEIWREYYIDELFDAEVEQPLWYSSDVQVEFDTPSYSIEDSLLSYFAIEPTEIDKEKNFEIIASLIDWNENDIFEVAWGKTRFILNNEINKALLYFDLIEFSYAKVVDFLKDGVTLRFVQKDGKNYYFVNDELFHIEEEDDNSFDFVTLSVDQYSQGVAPKAPVSFSIRQLK